jgi:hypothetical protein
MPSVLRRSGPDIERNGSLVTPRALISTCDHEGCGEAAPFGDNSSGKLLSWCRTHNPDRQFMAQRREA